MNRRPALFLLLCFTTALCCCLDSVAAAKTTLDVQAGWGDTVRIGRWNPVIVTLADPAGPDAVMEVKSDHDRLYGMTVREDLGTLSAQPKQFELLIPIDSYLSGDSDPLLLVVRDAKTGKVLAQTDPQDPSRPRTTLNWETVPAGSHFIGVSGQLSKLSELKNLVPGARLAADYLPLSLLPTTATGYDMLDVLVLNAPDLNELAFEQNQAIADWVRAGGHLVLWLGDAPLPPPSGKLMDLLPCTFGKLGMTELSEADLGRLKLSKRFGRLASRELVPTGGAEEVHLLAGTGVTGYRHNVGLGSVVVSPINLADFQFDNAEPLWAMWSTVLGPMFDLPSDALTNTTTTYNRYGFEPGSDDNFKQQVADVLGTVPGTGRFGFSYVAIVLIGMMVIVGPVDWFVLRLLNRQAWTWVTTSGWIALVTLGAIYIGHVVKSGELYYRTFSIIDQADGATVARQDLVGIYSPRTTEYKITPTADEWWQPFAPGMGMYYGGGERLNQMEFRQTYKDNVPAAMQINVWSLRFVEGGRIGNGDALLDASFTIERRSNGQTWAVGNVTNHNDRPLHGLLLLTAYGQTDFEPRATSGSDNPRVMIPPGATLQLAAALVPAPPQQQQEYGYMGNISGRGGADQSQLWTDATSIGGSRAARIGRLMRDGTHAILIGGVDAPAPPATLNVPPEKEQHWQFVRALVPIATPIQR